MDNSGNTPSFRDAYSLLSKFTALSEYPLYTLFIAVKVLGDISLYH